MSLEKEEIKLLQDSWNEVCAQSKEITQVGVELFIRMFTEEPDFIPLFKFAKNKTLKQLETSPRLAVHATNVMNVVAQGVAHAGELSSLVGYLTDLGGKHLKFGAEPKYFDVIGRNLIGVLKDKVGHNNWTDQHTAAWGKFYGIVTSTMMKGLEEAKSKS